jgi:transcriptional regulator with XRE-family HTH domain
MPTFGPLLRRTREARGIALDDIARETRLSKRYLVALEEEMLGTLPGGAYNRGYLRMYAEFLHLDADDLVRQYLAEEARQTVISEEALLATMNRAVDRRLQQTPPSDAVAISKSVNRPAILAAAVGGLVLVVSGAYYGFETVGGGPSPEPRVVGMSVMAPPAVPPADGSAGTGPTTASPSASKRRGRPARSYDPPPAVPLGSDPGPAATIDSESRKAEALQAPAASARQDAPRSGPQVAGSHLAVMGSGVGTAVVDRELVGKSDEFNSGRPVVFWTHVVGGRTGDTIDHVWFRDGSLVGASSLSVNSADWRTQSHRVLEPGAWIVEARDADGRVLARHEIHGRP